MRAVVAIAVLASAAELASRAYWRLAYDVSLRDARHVLFAFYPELRRVDGIHASRGDGHEEILLLGGSVLHKNWGAVEQALVEQLARDGRHDVRISNMAEPGQTSRDSLVKYRAMPNARFDRVIVYDGINDVRANNAPPDVFRDDYGHYAWYETVNALAPSQGTARLALPYTLRFAALSLRQWMDRRRYMPPGPIPSGWTAYGAQAKGANAFDRNIRDIVAIAAERGDPLTLVTFAIHVPPNYSLDAFRRHALDYDLHVSPIELWGRPADVVTTVERQNEMLRRLAARTRGVSLVDEATLMPRGAEYFNDVCHLTLEGSAAFAANLVAAWRGASAAH